MKRNYLFSLLLVGIVALLLSACGGDNVGSNPPASSGNNATTGSNNATTSNNSGASSGSASNAPSSGSGNVASAPATAKPQFIMFSTTWCEICKAMRPIVSELKTQYGDRISFREIDREDPANTAMVNKYKITAQPIFVMLDKQGNNVGRINGGTDKDTLKAALDKLLQ